MKKITINIIMIFLASSVFGQDITDIGNTYSDNQIKFKLTDSTLINQKGVHLYDESFSNNCLRVRLYLEERKIPYTKHVVKLIKKENYTDWYLKINPKALVPAMTHNGYSVTESNQIMRYLDATFEQGNKNLHITDTTRMWQWVDAAGKGHFETIKAYLYINRIGRPCFPDDLEFYKQHNPQLYEFHKKYTHPTPELVALTESRLSSMVQSLEDELKLNPYLLSEHFSLVDIAWFPNIDFLMIMNYDFSPYPNVKRWVKEIRKRESYKKSKMASYPYWLVKYIMRKRWKKLEKYENRQV
jgi:glutathione S-transferase